MMIAFFCKIVGKENSLLRRPAPPFSTLFQAILPSIGDGSVATHREIMKITCFKLVPEEQDIVVTQNTP